MYNFQRVYLNPNYIHFDDERWLPISNGARFLKENHFDYGYNLNEESVAESTANSDLFGSYFRTKNGFAKKCQAANFKTRKSLNANDRQD